MDNRIYRVIKLFFEPHSGEPCDQSIQFVEGTDSLIRNYVRVLADCEAEHEIQHGPRTPEGTCVVDSCEIDRGGNTIRAIRVFRVDRKLLNGGYHRVCEIIAETFYIKKRSDVERFILAADVAKETSGMADDEFCCNGCGATVHGDDQSAYIDDDEVRCAGCLEREADRVEAWCSKCGGVIRRGEPERILPNEDKLCDRCFQTFFPSVD